MGNQPAQTTSNNFGSTYSDASPEIATLRIDGWGDLGDTIAQFENGVINVFGAIPGELVKARIVRYRRRRRQHVSAIVIEVLDPSPHRITAPCAYFGACTGCQWQHIDYVHQLRLKQDRVIKALAEYLELSGIAVAPTLPSPAGVRLSQSRSLHSSPIWHARIH